jgi:sulfite exporter TauE/SafE
MEITGYITAALILGVAGSLHCIAMCGPLVTALESVSLQKRWTAPQFMYHAGRWTTYAVLGLAVGFVGQGFATLGLQRWSVLIAGITMIIFLFLPTLTHRIKFPFYGITNRLRTTMGNALQSRKLAHRFVFGLLNGLLPCGLVYTALAGSLAAAEAWKGSLFMLTFGVATTPGLLAVSQLTTWLKNRFKATTSKRIQLAFSIIALLVLLRGANLGIPFLSPHFDHPKQTMNCCHK